METAGLIESFQEFKEFKDIDRETLMKILEDVFRNMIQKNMGQMTITISLSILIKETLRCGETEPLFKKVKSKMITERLLMRMLLK
jgi:N utilization substance protein A